MSMQADFGCEDGEAPEYDDWDFEMEEETLEEARLRMRDDERAQDVAFDPATTPVRDPFSGEWV